METSTDAFFDEFGNFIGEYVVDASPDISKQRKRCDDYSRSIIWNITDIVKIILGKPLPQIQVMLL